MFGVGEADDFDLVSQFFTECGGLHGGTYTLTVAVDAEEVFDKDRDLETFGGGAID